MRMSVRVPMSVATSTVSLGTMLALITIAREIQLDTSSVAAITLMILSSIDDGLTLYTIETVVRQLQLFLRSGTH